MKYPFSAVFLLVALLVGSACSAPPDQSIIVSTARAPGPNCDFSDATKYIEGGALDVSVPPIFQSYFQIFSWENDLQNISVTVTSQITTETPNTFIATTIKDNYVMVGGTNPPNGLVSITASIGPGATSSQSDVGVYLITNEARQAICGAPSATDNCPNLVLTAAAPTATLLVTFQIAGALVGGGAAQTNPVTFPLTLFKGGTVVTTATGTLGCASGAAPRTTSCGIPGRDIPFCP
jgi:hypothetical protein